MIKVGTESKPINEASFEYLIDALVDEALWTSIGYADSGKEDAIKIELKKRYKQK